jgi:cobalamin biosynthesis Mg chelatase CobN
MFSQDLKKDGYDVGELPENEGDIMQSVLNDPEAKYNSADLNVAYKMSVDEYKKLCPYAEALEENWGKPPGEQTVKMLTIYTRMALAAQSWRKPRAKSLRVHMY